jgi:hypothetical protein
MATKAPVKKAAILTPKKAVKKVVAKKQAKTTEPMYKMPTEVSEWIERANSTIKHQAGKIATLEAEIRELKTYKSWASKRMTQSDYQD